MSDMSSLHPPRPSAPAAGKRTSDSLLDSGDLSGSIDMAPDTKPKSPTDSSLDLSSQTGSAKPAPKLMQPSPDPSQPAAPAGNENASVSMDSEDVSGEISAESSVLSTTSKKSGVKVREPRASAGGKDKREIQSEGSMSLSSERTSRSTPAKAPVAPESKATLTKAGDEDESPDVSFSTEPSSRPTPVKDTPDPKSKEAPETEDGTSNQDSGEISFGSERSSRTPSAKKPAAPEHKKAPARDGGDESGDISLGSERSSRTTPGKNLPAPAPKKAPSKDGGDESGDISLGSERSSRTTPGKNPPAPAPKKAPSMDGGDESGDIRLGSERSSRTTPAKKPPTPAPENVPVKVGQASGDISFSTETSLTTATSAKAPPAAAPKPAPAATQDDDDNDDAKSSISSSTHTSKASGTSTAASSRLPKEAASAKAKAPSAAAVSEYSNEFDKDEDEDQGQGDGSLVKASSKASSQVSSRVASRSVSLREKVASASKASAAGSFEEEDLEEDEDDEGSKLEPKGGQGSDGEYDDEGFIQEDDGDDDDEELDQVGGKDIVAPLKPGSASQRGSSAQRPTSARPGARPSSSQRSGSSNSYTPMSQLSQHSAEDEGDDDVQNSMDDEDVVPPSNAKRAPSNESRNHSGSSWRPASAASKLQSSPSGPARRPSASQDSWEGEVRTPPGLQHQPPRPVRPYSGRAGSDISDVQPVSRPPSGRQRPSSAAPRMRQGNEMTALARRHPATWDVRDVCLWIDSIGLQQYRKKFMHNIVDGRILLMLTDDQLKQELGIGPMGHRVALLRAIEALLDDHDREQGDHHSWGVSSRERPSTARPASSSRTRPTTTEHPRRPASASHAVIPPDRFLGPASGKMTVYEQRSKLLFELDRAAARAAQHKAIADQLAHTANLSEEEVLKLRALLQDLEHKNRLQVQNTTGSLDSHSRIPWRPVGQGSKVMNRNPERMARPGDDPSLDLTFKPRLSKETQRMFRESGGAGQSNFLDRLENDLRKRDRSKKELDKKYYSTEALFQDPMLAKKMYDRDLQFLKDYNAAKGLVDGQLSSREHELDMQINEMVGNYADTWKLKEKQVDAIMDAKGEKKVKAMASAIRAMLFMQRYESELRQRDDKLLSLQKKWWEMSMGKPRQKDQEDRAQMVEYFGLLGWRGEGEEAITDSRLRALLARAREYKKELEVWKERNRDKPRSLAGDPQISINWEAPPWSVDGLGHLMEAEMQRVQDATESKSSPPSGKTITTQHAGDGAISVNQMVVGRSPDYLSYTVKLLAGLRWDSLDKLDSLDNDSAKRLAFYRGIRTQKFLEFTEAKIRERERSMQELYQTLIPTKKVITPQQEDGFFERLLDDANKRRARVEKLMNDKMAKEKEILTSSKMYTRRSTR